MIIAVDFDGTLCTVNWPGIGEPCTDLIELLKKRRKDGDKLILWSCRCDRLLDEALSWCRQYGLEFDAVNDNLPEMTEKYGNNCRKVFADVYLDDKAFTPETFRTFSEQN